MLAKREHSELSQSVHAISKLIGQIPCFQVYEASVASRFGDTVAERALKAMTHNCALDSALISLRCFNEFFKKGGRPDDVRAHHFPNISMRPFLTPDEETAINKYLTHLTATRSHTTTKPWMLDDMTVRGLNHGVEVLTSIEKHFSMPSEDVADELHGVREAALLLLPTIPNQNTITNQP